MGDTYPLWDHGGMAERFEYETLRRKGNQVGKITAFLPGKTKPVGQLMLDRQEGDTQYPEPGREFVERDDHPTNPGQHQLFSHEQGPSVIDLIQVEERHQRKGIGRDMLNLARQQFGPLMYSPQATPAGFNWAQKHDVEVPVERPTLGRMRVNEGDVWGKRGSYGSQPVGARTVRPEPQKGPEPVQESLF